MITKETFIDQIEITRSDNIQIRLILALVEGSEIIQSKYHRTSIPLEMVKEQIRLVDAHLEEMGYPAVSKQDLKRLEKIVDALKVNLKAQK